MSRLLVGAPGRMRNGSRLPPVKSRTKKFASLPAMSQVCAVKPPALVWSRRMRRRIGGLNVEIERRRGRAEADIAGGREDERVGGRAGSELEDRAGCGRIFNREKIPAAAG